MFNQLHKIISSFILRLLKQLNTVMKNCISHDSIVYLILWGGLTGTRNNLYTKMYSIFLMCHEEIFI